MTKVFILARRYFTAPLLLGIVLSLALGYLTHFYYTSHQDLESIDKFPLLSEFERLHNQTIDFKLRQRGPRLGSENVAILTIDEEAIQKYGRWPWPRSLVAEVIEGVMSGGAKSISFDIIFSEKQDDLLKSIEQIQKKLNKNIPQQSAIIDKVLDEELISQDHDKKLVEVIEKYSEFLILGAIYNEFEYRPFPFQDSCFLNITKANGTYSYWDKEAFLIGAQNPLEINLPEGWNKIVLKHFNNLQKNVAYNWLQNNPTHPLSIFLTQNKYDLKKQNTVNLLTHYVRNEKSVFSKIAPNNSKLWDDFLVLLPQQKKVEIENQMNRELSDYCLRYLTKKDELQNSFKESWPKISQESDQLKNMNYEQAMDFYKGTNLVILAHQVDKWLYNIPPIQEVTVHSGTFNATQDKDGSVRRAKLFVRNGNLFIPSLAFKTYLVIKGYYPTVNLLPNPYENPPESSIVTNVQLKNSDDKMVLTIPTDHRGQLPINYAGPQKMFSYLSAGEILGGDEIINIEQKVQNKKGEWIDKKLKVNKKDYLKDKSFIFGATATGIYDLRVTPFEENYPGVETHANMLDNLLRQDYLKTSTQEEYYMPHFIWILGIIFSLLIARFGAIFGMLITLISLATLYCIDFYYIFSQGTVIVILFPIFTIILLYISMTFYKYFTEERTKKQLKGTFQKYVSPEIVNEILKDPSKLELGGIKQEMTVFFSDIRGFTTISEKLDPKALSDLLNHYLTPMTDIIFKNSGTLDKYMGDAIMAFFGAPIYSSEHAAQGCRAALKQIEKLFELQKIYVEKGLPMIDIGIGLNTGDMSVGNMGSETVRNYTVMGDSVNLGSRLEGINKEYGTRIIISEFTKNHLKPGEFVYREIDWVKVKGKTEPVKIYELIAEGSPTPEKKNQLEHFKAGFSYYHEKRWQQAIEEFNQAQTFDPADKTSQLYVKRCQDYLINPPDENWDGVFTMKTK
jgi:adenylate cyclase